MNIISIAATAALSTVLLAGGATTATAAEPTCELGEHIVAVWLRLPADLRSDLIDLRQFEPGERGDAARDIRGGALDGEYGPGVQDRAERVQQRRIHVIANMPPELRADLVELRTADPDDRRDLARDIADTALAGGYGDKSQQIAERIQAEVCA